ncbi:nuclear transport factor 2 family protein [Phytoactinopolyspora limicola]|uniref:nuclear transport factor 2 family protein n=1 Tax=Phytoactinopolyspora limicola TaxID=2715536 RepID=UPI00140CB7B7|nr:nuclear transport factor 2 family protein [Phytoactinopolyspora limicola]
MSDLNAAAVLRQLWELIDVQDWDGLSAVLDPDVHVLYVHTGERLDRAGYVRLNREYPGSWRAEILDLVATADRVVSHVRVTDAGREFHVASFGTVRSGRLVELVEVWTEGQQQPPGQARPVGTSPDGGVG